ncbi:hypothetical protein JCM19046_2911 [Bacillus sp. JCM 19046]|nr:hypothetical protein JCM19046_2911 [Bacillus sp. JCM 19046]
MRPIDETRKKILLSSFVIIGLLIGLYQFYQYKEKSLYAFGGIHFTDPESIFLTMPTIENELYSTDEDVINDFIAILSNYQAKKNHSAEYEELQQHDGVHLFTATLDSRSIFRLSTTHGLINNHYVKVTNGPIDEAAISDFYERHKDKFEVSEMID